MAAITARESAMLLGTLAELREKEARFRAACAAVGIEYVIADFGGLRTEAQVAQLIKWRDEAVAAARKKGGEAAAKKAWYPVATTEKGFHPVGGAFDIKITKHREANLDAAYARTWTIAPAVGLRALGSYDPFHFELPYPRAQVAARFAEAVKSAAVTVAKVGGGGAAIAGIAVLAFSLFTGRGK